MRTATGTAPTSARVGVSPSRRRRRRRRRWARATSSLEQLLRLGRGGYGARPARVEREMRDQLDQLVLGHAVLDGAREVEVHLLGLAQSDQRGAGDQAAVALRQLRALPHVTEQDFLGDLDELGAKSASGFFGVLMRPPAAAAVS